MITGNHFQDELIDSFNQILQKQLISKWLEWRDQGITRYKDIQESGFRCYSQFEEDGIILYLMTMLGITNGTCVEISCGQGIECMSTNLIINHGFKGYLFDGSSENIRCTKNFFRTKKDCMALKPEVRKAWMTRENVNSHLLAAGCPTDIDFLSIDIDGMDYWLWKAIDVISPKVCCIETHDWIPSNLSLTVPYEKNFSIDEAKVPGFRSASLLAMARLGEKKGYQLIGSHRHGFNAFFIREDLRPDFIKMVTPEHVHNNPATQRNQAMEWPKLKDCAWETV